MPSPLVLLACAVLIAAGMVAVVSLALHLWHWLRVVAETLRRMEYEPRRAPW